MIRPILLISTLAGLAATAQFSWEDHYQIESVPLPKSVDPQIGGLDITPDGALAACFHRGEVMIYDGKTWSLFASGLHEPLGLHCDDDGSIVVVQRAELTRLVDENGDGLADLYQTLCDDWGVSGNYHEFAFGLVKDSQGNFYLGLGTASNGSGVRDHIRGLWNDAGGLTQDKFTYRDNQEWAQKKQHVPRMYARVPYRGCVLKITPGKRQAQVYATGFRTPNGLHLDHNDQLWVSDNQGDWLGASKLYRVEQDKFYGHPASLLWADNPPTQTPANLPIPELQKRRQKAAALLPQGNCGNSITQQLNLAPAFAPTSSDDLILIGEMNHPRMPLYLPDRVHGQVQGAVTHFLNTSGLGNGNNRMVYSPDHNALYVGKTHLSWAGAEGLRKITYKGSPFLQTQSFKLHPKGFEIHFNDHIKGASTPSEYKIQSYELLYHAEYGSPNKKVRSEQVLNVQNKGDHLIIELESRPTANRIYDIQLPPRIHSDTLGPLSSQRYWYTAHQVYQ